MAEVLSLNPLFERVSAREKKFKEVAVLVHHYGGTRYSFKRQVEWLTDLGFDVVTFDLPFRTLSEMKNGLPMSRNWRIGLRHAWADKIEEVFGSVSENKIVFSFSFPSIAVLEAISRRHAIDVKAWVCEGGPFSDVTKATSRKIKKSGLVKISGKALDVPVIRRVLAKMTTFAFGTSRYYEDAKLYLHSLPMGFPILSLRDGQDELVLPDTIDRFFFQALNQIDLERATIPNAAHLAGLKDSPDEYKETVGWFLKRKATPVVSKF